MTHLIEMSLPGQGLSAAKMPAHWLLARLGKRVLRPGGLELTEQMLTALAVDSSDEVVEFAPGLGVTARLTLRRRPASFTGIERDETAAARGNSYLNGDDESQRHRCIVGRAEESGLQDESASVVYGEAMLTMQSHRQKARIVQEAFRLLKPTGRYGIHELCLNDETSDEVKKEIEQNLSGSLRVSARPLTVSEWKNLLDSAGFHVRCELQAPMKLLEPLRLIRDEGLFDASRFVFNVLRDREVRHRVVHMRKLFHKYQDRMAAISLIGTKPQESSK